MDLSKGSEPIPEIGCQDTKNSATGWIKRNSKISGITSRRGKSMVEEARLPCRGLRDLFGNRPCSPLGLARFLQKKDLLVWVFREEGKVSDGQQPASPISGIGLTIRITESNFRPDRSSIARGDQRDGRVSAPFKERNPPHGKRSTPFEKDFYQRWFERWEEKDPFNFEELFMASLGQSRQFP